MQKDFNGQSESLGEAFKGLVAMFPGGQLKDSIRTVEKDRTPQNVYNLALDVAGLVRDYSWFILGNEAVWEKSVLKMQALTEEAAHAGHADAALFAGIINTRNWGIGGTVTSLGMNGKASETTDLTREPVIRADIGRALEWFEKAAALGSEKGKKNVHIAREQLAKMNKPKPFTL